MMNLAPVVAAALAMATTGGSLSPTQLDAVKAAYHKLAPQDIEAKKVDAIPDGVQVERVDVSQRIRSASFGHKTTLLVKMSGGDGGAGEPTEFWVEHGKSTNRPAAWFGPFSMSEYAAPK